MTVETALEVLKLYEDWNTGQVSVSMAFKGIRTPEDDILDERRKLIAEASRTLRESK